LQTAGKARAWVWLIPHDPPSRMRQRHCGCVFTTLASFMQHPIVGVDEFPLT